MTTQVHPVRGAARAFLLLVPPLLGFVLATGFAEGNLDKETILVGGVTRSYLIHLPPERRAGMPLILALHGAGGTAEGMVRLTRGKFDSLADRFGICVVYPDGINRGWNDGRTDRALAGRTSVDDMGFLERLIRHLVRYDGVDSLKVCIAGMSNGGMMALRFGCSSSIGVRLVAAVAATMPVEVFPLARSVRGVSLMLFHGTEDPIVPFKGGEIRVLLRGRGVVASVDSTVGWWSRENDCTAKPTVRRISSDDGTAVTVKAFNGCGASVNVLEYEVEGGGHTWPGGKQYLGAWLVGKTTHAVDACDEIVRVLQESK